MATFRQKAAAKETVKIITGESELKTSKELLAKCSYGKGLQKQPNRVLESKGYLETLDKYLPDDYLADKHTELINDKESAIRIKALDLAYKVKGSYAPEKKQSVNLNLNTELKNSKQSRELIDEYEQKLQNMLKEPKN